MFSEVNFFAKGFSAHLLKDFLIKQYTLIFLPIAAIGKPNWRFHPHV